MNYILIIFATFSFEAGPSSQAISFPDKTKCELARQAVLANFERAINRNGWGLTRFSAVCVETGVAK